MVVVWKTELHLPKFRASEQQKLWATSLKEQNEVDANFVNLNKKQSLEERKSEERRNNPDKQDFPAQKESLMRGTVQ